MVCTCQVTGIVFNVHGYDLCCPDRQVHGQTTFEVIKACDILSC